MLQINKLEANLKLPLIQHTRKLTKMQSLIAGTPEVESDIVPETQIR
jgi:hypothetical protein